MSLGHRHNCPIALRSRHTSLPTPTGTTLSPVVYTVTERQSGICVQARVAWGTRAKAQRPGITDPSHRMSAPATP